MEIIDVTGPGKPSRLLINAICKLDKEAFAPLVNSGGIVECSLTVGGVEVPLSLILDDVGEQYERSVEFAAKERVAKMLTMSPTLNSIRNLEKTLKSSIRQLQYDLAEKVEKELGIKINFEWEDTY